MQENIIKLQKHLMFKSSRNPLENNNSNLQILVVNLVQ